MVAALAAFACAPWLPRDGLLLGGLLAAAGALLWHATYRPPESDLFFQWARDAPGTYVEVQGWVHQAPIIMADTDYARILVRVDTIVRGSESRAVDSGVVVRWSKPPMPVLPGQRIAANGRLDPNLGTVNFDVPGMEDRLRSSGYQASIDADGQALRVLATDRWSPRYWAGRLRQWEAEALARALPPATLAFALNVWLGDRSRIAGASYEQFLASGTAHILAVSGVHVGIVFVSLRGLLRLLRSRGRTAAILCAAGLVAFALAAGASVSVLRAVFMVLVYLLAEALRREPDVLNALGWAAAVFLIVNPALIFDAAFLLSFGSVASILIFSDLLQTRMNAVPQALRANVAVAAGVQILPFPIAMHYFHVFPVLGIAANMLVVPLLGVVLWLLALTVLVTPVLPAFAVLLGHAAGAVVTLIENLVEGVWWLQGGPWFLAGPTALGALAFWVATAALWWLLRHPHDRRAWALGAGALLCMLLAWTPWRQPDALDILDVGHGDALVVRTAAGGVLLVDGGDRDEYRDLGAQVVRPFLLAHGIDHIDTVVASHSDRDHMGGLIAVVDALSVGEVVLGPRRHGVTLEQTLLAVCAQRGIPVRRVTAGETLPLAGARVDVLHPPASGFPAHEANENSVVLRVQWPQGEALLTGDIEADAERLLVQILSPVALLKTPHHGSATSSTPAFLDALQARHALVSTHARGTRRPMGEGIAERYEERGTALWRTDLHGGLRATPTAQGWVIESARAGRGTLLAPHPVE
jgi:competence protein ComEC